jgi:hypothetical protein
LNKTDSPDAQQALKSIQEAVNTNKDVRILTASGLDKTQDELDKTDSSEGADDLENNIVKVARQASDLRMKGTPKDPSNQARSAMILTEDRLTRVRAARDHLAAIAPSMFKRILTGSRRKSLVQDRPAQFSLEPSKPTSFGDPMDQ